MTTMFTKSRARAFVGAVFGLLVALPAASAQTQGATITGRVTGEAGQPIEGANVYINELTVSVATNAQGVYTAVVPAARTLGQAVNLRVRAIGKAPGVSPIRVTPGSQTVNFTLRDDINRLNEVVVTGVVGEGVERSKVPFAVGRLTTEDLPVPALDPVTALQGKVAGVRIAQTTGRPGTSPEILLRGPTSINAAGRSQQPLFIVDGAILNVGSYQELGGLDIESVEVVKGAAGASIYGSTAANGVIVIKTKRGASQDGVRFTARSEYGISDVNSIDYGMPLNHQLQLDETGKRFCVAGAGAVSPCSRSVDWMSELHRINGVAEDTIRTGFGIQWGQPGSGGELLNVYQASAWPNRYWKTFAQIVTPNPVTSNSLDATGRVGAVRFFASGQYTSNAGAMRNLSGDLHRRARLNLDYDIRSNASVSLSTMYDRGTTDLHDISFGGLLRGAKPGTDYLARDTLGRYFLRGFGPTSSPTGNGAGGFFYNAENEILARVSERYLGSLNASYFPADWVTLDGTFAYDHRHRNDRDFWVKGYRTVSSSTSTNFGGGSIGNRNEEATNGAVGATFRKQVNEISGKLSIRGLFDQTVVNVDGTGGEQFIVKDVFTLSNTSTNKTNNSSKTLVKNMGFFSGASVDYKGKYILDGTFRYDGSSLFGAGNRWAPFGRVSAVWRVSEEPFWHVPKVSDFRLRASNGTAGNTPRFTAQYETYDCTATGCSLGQAGNAKLKPETTREIEVGTDFTLYNRLGLEFTHVNSKTTNQILNVPTPATLGFSNQWQNAGTLASTTWEAAANLPVISRRNLTWTMRYTWDRTRTFVTELFRPDYFQGGGTGQGTGSFFFITANDSVVDGYKMNRYGNIWGRKFYKTCGDLPQAVQGQCGEGKAYQVNDKGWLVWVGEGNSWRDGITKNLWQTKLPAAQSPWNYPLQFGHPIVDRPLKGLPGEGIGTLHILGNTLPDFRLTLNNTVTFKRLTLFGLVDGTFGHFINNQGEQWGLLDFASANYDQKDNTVETAKPLGYAWRVGGSEGAGSGGFYDILGPNNYSVEKGSYAKIRELSVTYRVGRVKGIGGDWTLGFIGRNLFTFTNYTGYDPETGVAGGNASSGLINQTDAFDFPTLRQFTLNLSTRF